MLYLTTEVVEVVEAVVLFDIKAWDKAIHEAVVVGEMRIEDMAEVAIDASAVATMKVRSTGG
jgi:pyruvate-formate lyase-activating enzyme